MQPKDNANQDRIHLTHTADEPGKHMGAVVAPIFMNSLHVFDTIEEFEALDGYAYDKYLYGRDCNPTVAVLEQKLAALEHGTRATVFASGMAACTAAIMATCKAGSHIICISDTYTTIRDAIKRVFAPRFGMSFSFVSGLDMEELELAIRENTDLIVLESPASMYFRGMDLRAIAAVARRHGIKTYIDNTNASPIFQKPLELGIDIVMHSTSKYISGHSDAIGGVLITKDDELNRILVEDIREHVGGIMGPMEAYLTTRGLRTLEIRMHAYYKTGLAVAEYLERHPKVRKVFYSGLASHPQAELLAGQQTGHGGLMSFLLNAETVEEARAFVNRLQLFGRGGSWGGYESLVLLPFHGVGREDMDMMGADPRLIRIYCGLEGADHLIADLEQALEGV